MEYVLDKYLDRSFKGVRNCKGIERKILKMSLGVCGYEKTKHSVIADMYNLSESTISVIKRRALTKLKKVEESEFYYEPFFDESDDQGYSSFKYEDIIDAPRECILCGLPIEEELRPGIRRHRECSFDRMVMEKSAFFKKKPRDISYRKVWEDYHGKIPKGMHIHHIDGDNSNSKISNLMLVTPEQHYEIHLNQKDYFAANMLYNKFLKNK